MSKVYDFINECGFFYVVTMNGDFPAARPFGAIMEVNEDLYIATHTANEAHKQLRTNGNMQIIAKKPDTREWIRVTGVAEECNDIYIKQKFIDENPAVARHYESAESDNYLVFRVKVQNAEFK